MADGLSPENRALFRATVGTDPRWFDEALREVPLNRLLNAARAEGLTALVEQGERIEGLENSLSWDKSSRESTDWRTIDSAPRDGTPVLIACDRTQSIRWAVWSECFWRDGQASAGGRIAGLPDPTHWTPPPEPPAPNPSTKGG